MSEKSKIKMWLEGNRDQRVLGNEMLTEAQISGVSGTLTDLVSELENGADEQDIIKRGNIVLYEMNNMINAKRMQDVLTIDQFKNLVLEEKGPNDQKNCKTIMEMFDTMLGCHEYDKVIQYMNSVDLDKVHAGIPIWIFQSTNPISPLLRPIPRKEDILALMAFRYAFSEKCVKYYKDRGDEEMAKHMQRTEKPDAYEKTVSEYDMLYLGGAPKEQYIK